MTEAALSRDRSLEAAEEVLLCVPASGVIVGGCSL